MQKLVWQNANGDEINLTGGNYGITEWEGFSNASLNIQNQQVPFQDGAVFLDALIEPRELSVTLKMQDKGNLEERYRMRRELIHILNPKLGEGYLIYTNDFISKRIKCIPQIPLFETHNSDTRGTPKASLAWIACEPYWEDLEETVVDLGYENTINNEGDVEVGVDVEIVSTKESFELTNITQDKKISVRQGGYGRFRLNTNFGQKKLEKIFYDYLVNGAYVNSTIYENDKLFYGCDGGFVCSTSDFKTIQIKNINVDNPNSRFQLNHFCKKGDYIYCVENYIGVLRSKDFENWETVYQDGGDYLNLKILDNGRLIFDNKKYSDDGVNWISFSGTSTYIESIIFVPSKNKYYIIDSNNNIASSSNLINWNIEYQGQGGTYNFDSIFYNLESEKFILTTENYNNYKILVTENFSSFTETYSSNSYFRIIQYNNNIFIYDNNNLKISLNGGVTFENTDFTEEGVSIVNIFRIGSVYYITLDNLSIIFSNNLTNWGYVLNTNILSYMMSIGSDGIQKLSNNEIFWTGEFSTNPKRCFILKNNGNVVMSESMWFTSNPNLSMEYYNNEYYLLCETNNIKKSTDGKNFTSLSTIDSGSTQLIHLFRTNNEFVVITTVDIVFISNDALTWQSHTISYYIKNRPIYFNGKWYTILTDTTRTYFYIGSSDNGYDYIIEQNIERAHGGSTGFDIRIKLCENILTLGYTYSNTNNEAVGVVIYEKGINTEWTIKYISTIIKAVKSVIKKYNKYICFGAFENELAHLIEIYSDKNIINYNSIIKTQMQDLMYMNNEKIFMVGYAYFGFLDENGIPENCIDLLSKDSDMTLGLNIGNNTIINNSNGNLLLKYRQKYLGV